MSEMPKEKQEEIFEKIKMKEENEERNEYKTA